MVNIERQSDKEIIKMMADANSCGDEDELECNRREYIFDIFSCAWMQQRVFASRLEARDETELEDFLFDSIRSTCTNVFDISFYRLMKFIIEGEIMPEDLEKVRKKVNITLC